MAFGHILGFVGRSIVNGVKTTGTALSQVGTDCSDAFNNTEEVKALREQEAKLKAEIKAKERKEREAQALKEKAARIAALKAALTANKTQAKLAKQ